MIYSIEVGKWTGAFGFVWYADVYNSEEHHRIVTFNALSKKAARAKAARFIRRLHGVGSGPEREVTMYAYDAKTREIRELPIQDANQENVGN